MIKMMNIETNEKITDYLEVCERVKPVVEDAAIVAAVIEQCGKDSRCAMMMNGRSIGNGNGHSGGNGDELATEKQLGFMKKLGVNVPDQCSKREASRLIDTAQANAA